MESVFERLIQPAILIPFFVFGLPVLAWAVKGSFSSMARARVEEAEIQLKREMIAQGRSAEEIERILHSNRPGKMNV